MTGSGALAWYMHLNVGAIGFQETKDKYRRGLPLVWFTPLRTGGWVLNTYFTAAAKQAACANLKNAHYLITPSHPGGIVIHPSAQ